jgi:hypothetical protein
MLHQDVISKPSIAAVVLEAQAHSVNVHLWLALVVTTGYNDAQPKARGNSMEFRAVRMICTVARGFREVSNHGLG